ncbi:hypothetical protein MBRA_26780 [Mycobacterium branderi]|uniref:PPE family protein n=1 Tax=Mycobacterium branderi TaxID=43348 RepID=A0ABN6B7A7_9MYCO|nr:hypothetical protein MBRA_26780 [Mycobacterium branderi]
MLDFGLLPPEVNSARMYAGAGPGSMLAAAAGWDGLATELHSGATSYQSVVTGLVTGPWQGPASAAMGAAAAPYVAWLSATAAQCEQVANQARAAVSAYEAAFAMTVPPPVIAANRAQLMALVATNFLGQNTPAIMATEAHYGEMWAQDAAAMYGYAASSAAAATLAPFSPPPHNTNPAGLAGQAAAVAHSAGTSAGSHAQTMTSSLSAVPQTLQSLASPTGSGSGMSQMVMGTGTSAATSAASAPASALTALTGASGKGAIKGASKTADVGGGALSGLAGAFGGTESLGLIEDTVGLEMDGVGLVGLDGGGVGLDLIGVGLDFLGADELTESGGLGPLGGLGGLAPLGAGLGQVGGLGGAGASASIGQAASLGGLSVPQSWAASMGPASAMPLPGTGMTAAPTISTTASGMPKIAFPSMAMREADGAVRSVGLRSSVLPHSPMAG